MKKAYLIISAVLLSVVANAAEVTYTGANGGNWSVDANWSDSAVPGSDDSAVINSGSTVNFDYGSGWPANNAISVQVDGTVEAANAVRSWATVWNIKSTGTLDLGANWLVPWGGGAEFSFDSGATLNMTGTIQFGSGGSTLGFNLAAGGFDTLSAGALDFGSGYAGNTIKVDMANYTGAGGTIVLIDLGSNNGVTDALFQGLTLDVANAGAYAGSYLQWNETTSAIELVIPTSTLMWDNGGIDTLFATADNWDTDVAPVSTNDNVAFYSGDSTTAYLASEFTIGNGNSFTNNATYTFRIGNNGHLTLASGGTLDFATGGNGILAQGGSNMRLTVESGATAKTWRFFEDSNFTTEFIADATGVTTFEVTGLLGLDGGTLDVDLTNYDLSNGNVLILFDYANFLGAGTFGATNLTTPTAGWSATVDYAYDQGGGDLAVALILDVDRVWDNGGADSLFSTDGNWDVDVAPVSTNDSVCFYTNDSGTAYLSSEFTIGNGEHFTNNAAYTFRLGNNGHLTVATGGRLDFATGGNGILAQGGSNMRLTIEPGATAKTWRFFEDANYTTEFIADASGVSTLEVTDILGLNGGALDVDLTNYDLSNGDVLILIDHAAGGGAFGATNLTAGWSGTIDYAYDQGVDDVAVALTGLVRTLTWDNGGSGGLFATADNWDLDETPISTYDSIVLDSSAGAAYLGSEFTIGNGQSMTAQNSSPDAVVMFIGAGGDLTVATGGTLDLLTGSQQGGIAESGTVNQCLTLEAGGTARVYKYWNSNGSYTNRFIADADGVTTLEIENRFTLRAGSSVLEVDLTSYDALNGDTLVLFDYGELFGDMTFGSVVVVGNEFATIDYAFDQGGGDLAVVLTNLQGLDGTLFKFR